MISVNKATSFPVGVYFVKSAHNGLYLDAKGEGMKSGTKAIVSTHVSSDRCELELKISADYEVWSLNGNKNQMWSFEGDGTIRNINNGLVLDLEGGKGAQVVCNEQKPASSVAASQLWAWDGKHLINKLDGRVLDVKGEGRSAGTYVIVWEVKLGAETKSNQEWILEPIQKSTK